MGAHINPTREHLIAAINATADELQSPEMSKTRQNFIMHVPIAMLECMGVDKNNRSLLIFLYAAKECNV